MPTYDYFCAKCGNRLEAFQKITDAPLEECPSCHAKSLQRGPGGGIGLAFKGSGFYITDYASGDKPEGGSSTPSSGDKGACGCGKSGGCSSGKS